MKDYPVNKMIDLVIDSLRSSFKGQLSSIVVKEVNADINYRYFQICFIVYNYYPVTFSFDKGSIGFSMPYIGFKSSQKWWDSADIKKLIKDFKTDLCSRIPEKYLKYFSNRNMVEEPVWIDTNEKSKMIYDSLRRYFENNIALSFIKNLPYDGKNVGFTVDFCLYEIFNITFQYKNNHIQFWINYGDSVIPLHLSYNEWNPALFDQLFLELKEELIARIPDNYFKEKGEQ